MYDLASHQYGLVADGGAGSRNGLKTSFDKSFVRQLQAVLYELNATLHRPPQAERMCRSGALCTAAEGSVTVSGEEQRATWCGNHHPASGLSSDPWSIWPRLLKGAATLPMCWCHALTGPEAHFGRRHLSLLHWKTVKPSHPKASWRHPSSSQKTGTLDCRCHSWQIYCWLSGLAIVGQSRACPIS